MSRFIVTLALLMNFVSVGHAATFYSVEADFVAATGFITAESFESFADSGGLTLSLISVPGFSISTAPDLNLGILDATFQEVHATDGTRTAFWGAFASNQNVTFSFDSPITAFGTMITDALDGGLPGAQLLLSTNGGDNSVVASGALQTGNEIFFGLVGAAPFTQLTFTVTQMPSTGDGLGFDEVRLTAVPEPSTAGLVLLGLGLSMLAARRCRRE